MRLLQFSHYCLLIYWLYPCEIPPFLFFPPSLKACGPRLLTANPTSKANSARLYSRSFTPLAVFFLSFQLIPPDENLVGHFKASARGLTALDLTVSDSLLVLWSLSQSLKGLLQPIYSNPLFRVQLDQKGTQCNPKDRGRMENTRNSNITAWQSHRHLWSVGSNEPFPFCSSS